MLIYYSTNGGLMAHMCASCSVYGRVSTEEISVTRPGELIKWENSNKTCYSVNLRHDQSTLTRAIAGVLSVFKKGGSIYMVDCSRVLPKWCTMMLAVYPTHMLQYIYRREKAIAEHVSQWERAI